MNPSSTSNRPITVSAKMPFGLPGDFETVLPIEKVVKNIMWLNSEYTYADELAELAPAWKDLMYYFADTPTIAWYVGSDLILTAQGEETMRRFWYAFHKIVCEVEDTGLDLFELMDSVDWSAKDWNYKNQYYEG
jgi:hypothetical protein